MTIATVRVQRLEWHETNKDPAANEFCHNIFPSLFHVWKRKKVSAIRTLQFLSQKRCTLLSSYLQAHQLQPTHPNPEMHPDVALIRFNHSFLIHFLLVTTTTTPLTSMCSKPFSGTSAALAAPQQRSAGSTELSACFQGKPTQNVKCSWIK